MVTTGIRCIPCPGINSSRKQLPPVVSLSMFTVAPLQSSLAVGGVNLVKLYNLSSHLLLPAPMVGACVSTSCDHLSSVAEWLPQASVASHVLCKLSRKSYRLLSLQDVHSCSTAVITCCWRCECWCGCTIYRCISYLHHQLSAACVSTDCDHLGSVAEWLPQASVASHVLV